GILVQLRSPGGWARLSTNRGGVPAVGFAASGALSVIEVKRIALRGGNLARSADFYARLFGTETRTQDRSASRDFAIGDGAFSIAQSTSPGNDEVLDFIEFGVKAFAPNVVRQTLRERGIISENGANARQLRINDPDGLAIRLQS